MLADSHPVFCTSVKRKRTKENQNKLPSIGVSCMCASAIFLNPWSNCFMSIPIYMVPTSFYFRNSLTCILTESCFYLTLNSESFFSPRDAIYIFPLRARRKTSKTCFLSLTKKTPLIPAAWPPSPVSPRIPPGAPCSPRRCLPLLPVCSCDHQPPAPAPPGGADPRTLE